MTQYSRVFITLMQDRAGFGLRSREPSGRAIIEVKDGRGKVSITAQELKGETVYKAYTVSTARNCIAVEMGKLNVDARGKAELKWDFDPFDVERTGIPIDEFDVVTVVAKSPADNAWVLTGYRDGEVRFKDKFNELKKQEEPDVQAAVKPAEAPVVQVEAEPAEEPAEVQYTPEPEPYQEAEYEPQPVYETEYEPEHGFEPAPDMHEKFRTVAQKFNKELEDLEDLMSEGNPNGSKVDLKTLIENSAAMTPFKAGFEEVKWVKISPKDITYLPSYCWKLMYEPYINLVFSKYKHLMLGAYANSPRYILALPDAYDPSHEQHARRLGFDVFMASDNIVGGNHNEEYGYWLMEFEV